MSLIYSKLVFVYDVCVCVCVYVLSCVWLIAVPRLPVSSVHGIFQARILELVTVSYSMGSSWPRDWTHVSCPCLLHCRQILYHWATGGNVSLQCSIGIQISYFSHMDNWLFQNIYWNIYPYILLVVCSYTFPMYQVFIEAGVYFRILSSIRQFASPLTNTTILITTSLWESLIFGSIGSST